MALPKVAKAPTPRSIAAKLRAEEAKQRKLHVIAERRAKSHGMTKKEYIAAIVKGEFRGITPEDIAEEEDPGVPEAAPAPVSAEVKA